MPNLASVRLALATMLLATAMCRCLDFPAVRSPALLQPRPELQPRSRPTVQGPRQPNAQLCLYLSCPSDSAAGNRRLQAPSVPSSMGPSLAAAQARAAAEARADKAEAQAARLQQEVQGLQGGCSLASLRGCVKPSRRSSQIEGCAMPAPDSLPCKL